MKKKPAAFIVCFLCIAFAQAQQLYTPRNIKHAYKSGTRSADGKPGTNYWQNTARYNISITAMPPSRTISGEEDITYFNNSPQSLSSIVMRLVLNIHKPGVPRNGYAGKDYLTRGIQIDSFSLDGETKVWKK